MERGMIVTEFHQLRTYLNRANKLSNQKTELKFRIESLVLFEYQLSVICVGATESHRLALCHRGRSRTWERTGNTIFGGLEEFCAKVLNSAEALDAIPFRTVQLSSRQLEKLEGEVSHQLKSLLLNKNYEP